MRSAPTGAARLGGSHPVHDLSRPAPGHLRELPASSPTRESYASPATPDRRLGRAVARRLLVGRRRLRRALRAGQARRELHAVPRRARCRPDSDAAQRADDMCLSCHESGAAEPGRRELLGMGTAASPPDIRSEITRPVVHRGARCVDCHSVHGIARLPGGGSTTSTSDASNRRPSVASAPRPTCACRATGPVRRRRPIRTTSGCSSTRGTPRTTRCWRWRAVPFRACSPPLTTDSMVNCSDCHASDDPGAARGPHGSRVPGLARRRLLAAGRPARVAVDLPPVLLLPRSRRRARRGPVSAASAARGRRSNLVRLCHDPHGATAARALIRFNEPTSITGVQSVELRTARVRSECPAGDGRATSPATGWTTIPSATAHVHPRWSAEVCRSEPRRGLGPPSGRRSGAAAVRRPSPTAGRTERRLGGRCGSAAGFDQESRDVGH